MQTEIIIAGFGGQGVLFGGMLLAQTAVEENKQTTWFPSYGAEMRGGTANSTVIISNDEIGAPIASTPNVLIAMNEQSLIKFLPKLDINPAIIINSSLVNNINEYNSYKPFFIPATELADKELNDVRTTNLIIIGKYIRQSGILKLESALKACEKVLAEKPKLIPMNQNALTIGYNYI